jgi:transposase
MHMRKAMVQMNLQIQHVMSDMTGTTGIAIIEAILAGERDPRKLAQLRNWRIKASEETIARSLVGRYQPEHLLEPRQAYDTWRHFQRQIDDCDAEPAKLLAQFDSRADQNTKPLAEVRPSDIKPQRNEIDLPGGHLRSRMRCVYGVDIAAVPGIAATNVHTLFSEIGRDLSAFPTDKQFANWLGLSPNNKVGGGRRLSSHTAKVRSRVATMLGMSAQSLRSGQSWLGGCCRRMRTRLGAPKAIAATAHKLARIIYHMIKTKQPYDETVFQIQEQRYNERKLQHAARLLIANGFQIASNHNLAPT